MESEAAIQIVAQETPRSLSVSVLSHPAGTFLRMRLAGLASPSTPSLTTSHPSCWNPKMSFQPQVTLTAGSRRKLPRQGSVARDSGPGSRYAAGVGNSHRHFQVWTSRPGGWSGGCPGHYLRMPLEDVVLHSLWAPCATAGPLEVGLGSEGPGPRVPPGAGKLQWLGHSQSCS